MAYRPHGKARVDPEQPISFAICDRCGSLFNRTDLSFQHQWQGTNLHNKRILVCESCLDRPSLFLRAVVVPADPQPIFNVRAELYTIDERSNVELRGPLGAPGAIKMHARSGMVAELTRT